MKERMHKYVQETDRWHNRAISPLSFTSKADAQKPTIMVHPGWGKRPEILKYLLFELAEAGTRPIGVDTRFGYSDKFNHSGYTFNSKTGGRTTTQKYRVGTENPFFDVSSADDNKYRLRRPTGLVALMLELDIDEASMFGHSEGGRVVSTVAAESKIPLSVPKLVVANSVGVGETQGIEGQLKSNTSNNELFDSENLKTLSEAVPSALLSTIYAATHPRRWWREKAVIESADIWENLQICSVQNGTEVTVIHAIADHVIDYASSAAKAEQYPNIAFVSTEGSHSNVYTQAFRDVVVPLLAA